MGSAAQSIMRVETAADELKSVYLYEELVYFTDSGEEVSAYLKGLIDGLTYSRGDQSEKSSPRFTIDIRMQGEEVRQRYFAEENIDHSYALFIFAADKITGYDFAEKIITLFGEIIVRMQAAREAKLMPLSLVILPQTVNCCGTEAVCVYIGCDDDLCGSGMLYDSLNAELRTMEGYIVAEAFEPEEDYPFAAYFEPATRTLYLARQLGQAINYVELHKCN